MSDPIRVVLADDHPIYREGVARTLTDAGGIEVVGQASDGEAAARVTGARNPDLVLPGIPTPRGGGLGALTRIMQLPKPPFVAMLTASEDEADLLQAMRPGAFGYVGAGELVGLVLETRGRAMSPPVWLGGSWWRCAPARRGGVEENPLADLSRREEDIRIRPA